jgi:hypothetical protein
MKTCLLFLTLPLFLISAFPGLAGVIGGLGDLPPVALTVSPALDYALQEYDESLFRDSADLHADIFSSAFVDTISPTSGKTGDSKATFILTTAQSRTIHQITGEHAPARLERETDGAVDPVDSIRTLEASVNTASLPFDLFPEAAPAMGISISSHPASSPGDSSSEDTGFTTMEIIGYELSKPWLYATALLCTFGLILLIAIRRRTSTPPTSL